MSERAMSVSRRATWSIICVALVLPTFVTLAYFELASSYSPTAVKLVYGIGKFIQFVLPVIWLCCVERRRLFSAPRRSTGLRSGIAFGLAVFVGMLALYHLWLQPSQLLDGALPVIQQKLVAFGCTTSFRYAALGIFYSVLHSFLEEYYWRWFVYGRCRQVLRPLAANLLSSAGFAAHHVLLLAAFFGWTSPLTWLLSAAVFLGGVVWAVIYERSGSLWGIWASHLLIDAGIFLVGYQLARGLLTA